MYTVKVVSEFSGAHRLRHYKGKCEELHGHNWKIEAAVESDTLGAAGMVIDFKELKKHLGKILDLLDHKDLNSLPYFKKINPTSENISKFIYDKLAPIINAKNVNLKELTVWETDRSAALYHEK